MLSLITNSSILFVLKDSKALLLFQQQIFKDFEPFNSNFPTNFCENVLNFEKISDIVKNNLLNIVSLGETQLLQLMYRIDIPEKQFLKLTNESDFLDKLNTLILIREAQKVYFRITYSSQ